MEPRADDRSATVLVREEAAPAAESPAPARSQVPTLLEAVLSASTAQSRPETSSRSNSVTTLRAFLDEPSPWKSLGFWLGLGADSSALPSRDLAARQLNRDIARIDALIDSQLNALIHHPSFQKLEASWRGLQLLVSKIPEGGEGIKVKVLNAKPYAG